MALALLVLNGVFIAIGLFPVSKAMDALVSFAAFPLVWSAVVLPAVWLLLLAVRRPALAFAKRSVGWMFLSVILSVSSVEGALAARELLFQREAERAAPLVAAITRFADEYGAPPTDLGGLVPQFVEEVPRPARSSCGYLYSAPPGTSKEAWELVVACDFDALVFRKTRANAILFSHAATDKLRYRYSAYESGRLPPGWRRTRNYLKWRDPLSACTEADEFSPRPPSGSPCN